MVMASPKFRAASLQSVGEMFDIPEYVSAFATRLRLASQNFGLAIPSWRHAKVFNLGFVEL
jgi:hypothetical protein